MKMPTTVSRHKFPWKPGQTVSLPVGEEYVFRRNHSPPARLTSGRSAIPATLPVRDQGADIGSAKGQAETEVTAVTRSRDSDRLVRYPILGPTRQDTELYFRRRRDQKRTLVSRSEEQGHDTDLPFRSRSAEKRHFHSSNGRKSIEEVGKASSNTTTAFNNGRGQGGGRLSSVARISNSAPTTTSLLLEPSSLPASPWRGKTTNRKSQVPTQSVSVFSHRGKHDQTQVLQLSSLRRYSPTMVVSSADEDCFVAKTLKPSKYGFHLRSQSPTFRRLVAVADKLQTALGVSSTDRLEPQRWPFLDLGGTSRAVVYLPGVNGTGTGSETEACDGDEQLTANDDVDEEKEKRMVSGAWLRSSLKEESELSRAVSSDKFASRDIVLPSDTLRCFQAGADLDGIQTQLPGNDLRRSDVVPDKILGNKANGSNCVGSSEVHDSGRRRENHSLTMTEGPNSISEHFCEDFPQPLGLSRQADTITASNNAVGALPAVSASSREASRGEQEVPPWTRARSKTMPLLQKLSRENTPLSRISHVSHVKHDSFDKSLASPHHSYQRDQAQLHQLPTEPSSKLGVTRLSSFSRAAKRNVTPKRVQFSPSFSEERHEPFLKGERLKERLEDFPTLISQDREENRGNSTRLLKLF